MSFVSPAMDVLSRLAQIIFALGAQFVSFAKAWLANGAIMRPVVYISGVTILLLAVLYASAPSRRPRATAIKLAREETMSAKPAEAVESNPALSRATEIEHPEHDSDIACRLREIQDDLAVLKSKLEGLEISGTIREEPRAAASGVGSDLQTAALRKELEALSAEMGGDS